MFDFFYGIEMITFVQSIFPTYNLLQYHNITFVTNVSCLLPFSGLCNILI